MNQLQDIERLYLEKLTTLYGRDESSSIFYIVTEEVMGVARASYTLQKDSYITDEQHQRFVHILRSLAANKPIQHILHKAHFYGEDFEVNEFVLIPRPETEELVDMIIKHHRQATKQLNIIDIGTGSGCIPIILKKRLPISTVSALDISKEAIAVAKRNATQLGAVVNFVNADILEWEYIFAKDQKYDIIVSNPPYITPKEKEEMHPNVLEFEPHLALFVEEAAPLLFYETIASFALQHLAASGHLYFEINQYYGSQTINMLLKKGFSSVQLFKDINQADRMIHAQI